VSGLVGSNVLVVIVIVFIASQSGGCMAGSTMGSDHAIAPGTRSSERFRRPKDSEGRSGSVS